MAVSWTIPDGWQQLRAAAFEKPLIIVTHPWQIEKGESLCAEVLFNKNHLA